tara:strand:+ start:877 stop:993 length:117 start_codon:yes stop_codon:yes gene_type:complete
MLINFLKKIKFFDNKEDLEARFWVQKMLLKKTLNSLKY